MSIVAHQRRRRRRAEEGVIQYTIYILYYIFNPINSREEFILYRNENYKSKIGRGLPWSIAGTCWSMVWKSVGLHPSFSIPQKTFADRSDRLSSRPH